MKASDVLGKLLGRLPEVATTKAAVFADPPETGGPEGMPDLPETAMSRPVGQPEETPATPGLPDQAADRNEETGLPYVAMDHFPDPFPGEADRFEEEEADLIS